MKNKVFFWFFMFLIILNITSLNASTDLIKDTEKTTFLQKEINVSNPKIIYIKDDFDNYFGEMKLLTPLHKLILIEGDSSVNETAFEIEFNLSKDDPRIKEFISRTDTYLEDSKNEVYKEKNQDIHYQVRYILGYKTVQDFNLICLEKSVNNLTFNGDTTVCEYVKSGTHSEPVYDWMDINRKSIDILSSGHFVIRGITDVVSGERVEWVTTFFDNLTINEWADYSTYTKYERYEGGVAGANFQGDGGVRLGQTFTVGSTGSNESFILFGISLDLNDNGNDGLGMFGVTEITGLDTAVPLSPYNLSYSIINTTEMGQGVNAWVNSTWVKNPTLSPGKTYAFYANFDNYFGNINPNPHVSYIKFSGGAKTDNGDGYTDGLTISCDPFPSGCGALDQDFNFIIYGVTIQAPTIEIVSPEPKNYGYNESIPLNHTTSDGNLDTCIFNVRNSTGALLVQNTTLSSCGNATFDLPGDEEDYTLNLFANDTLAFTNSSSVSFGIRMNSPSISLDYPTDNSWLSSILTYINFTSTDSDGLDTCTLEGDFGGSWDLNYSWIYPNSGVQNHTTLSLDEGNYSWNIGCNDTINNFGVSQTNFSFSIDRTNPLNKIDTANQTSFTSLSFSIDYNITDENLGSCYYTLRDSSDVVHNYLENTSLSCTNNEINLSTLTEGTFTFSLWGEDFAGNINYSIVSFSTSIPSAEGGAGGGGSSTQEYPVISIAQLESIKLTGLERAIIYAKINNFCSEKITRESLAISDFSEECILSQSDVPTIMSMITDISVDLSEEDLFEFMKLYKGKNFEQFFATKSEIDEYGLFSSVLGLTQLLKLDPPRIDKFFFINTKGGEVTIPYRVSANKQLKSCETISETEGLECSVKNNTIEIRYFIKDTSFVSRVFTGTVEVTTESPTDTIEIKRLTMALRVFNYGNIGGIIILSLGGVIFLGIVLFSGKKRSSNRIKETVKKVKGGLRLK